MKLIKYLLYNLLQCEYNDFRYYKYLTICVNNLYNLIPLKHIVPSNNRQRNLKQRGVFRVESCCTCLYLIFQWRAFNYRQAIKYVCLLFVVFTVECTCLKSIFWKYYNFLSELEIYFWKMFLKLYIISQINNTVQGIRCRLIIKNQSI